MTLAFKDTPMSKKEAIEKALEFYADFDNYCGYGASSPVDIDCGEKARAALKKARGQSND